MWEIEKNDEIEITNNENSLLNSEGDLIDNKYSILVNELLEMRSNIDS